jgi:hypothetical protein
MPARISINGILLLDGQPLGDQDILLISADMARFLGTCTTGPDGRFACALSPRAAPAAVMVLAKVKASVATVLYQVVEVPQATPVEFRVDSQGNFMTVTGSINTAVGWPPHLNVFLNPVMIDGIPERLQRFFNQKAKGVVDVYFIKTAIREPAFFSFRVVSGIYAIGGAYLNYDRPMTVQPDYQNFIVRAVTVEPTGEQLAGDPYGGFQLSVAGDCQIRLALRVVEDREL